MAESEAGLELPIGLTEQKFLQQLARIEAKAIKSAQKAEQGFVRSNQHIVKSFGTMSNQSRAQIQNVSYQLQDMFVQISGGQGAARALSQQIPQLLGGFGALGAVIGTVAAVAIPLAANFLGASEEAAKLSDNVEAAQKALAAYREAVENANTPTSELVEKFGNLSVSAVALLDNLKVVAKLEALQEQKGAVDGLVTAFDGLGEAARFAEAEIARIGSDAQGIENLNRQMQDGFGLTIEQASQLADIIGEISNGASGERLVSLLTDAGTVLRDAVESGGDLDREIIKTVGDANRAALVIAEIEAMTSGAANEAARLGDNFAAAAVEAAKTAAAIQAAQAASPSWMTPGGVSSVNPFNPGQGAAITEAAGGATVAAQFDFAAEWEKRLAKLSRSASGRRSGGGSRGRGSGSKSSKKDDPLSFLEDATRDIRDLERQLELVGKSSEEVATLKARWELLDEAKKRGITVNEGLNAQIDAQAQKFGQLTAELERAEIAQEQFDQAVEGIADAMAGALVAGESLREGLANVFKGIAADLVKSGISQMISGLFSGSGGTILGGLFGGGKTASFDGGGFTGYGSRSGGIDGRGGFPAILHPNETVVDHTKGQNMSGPVNININVSGARGNAEIQDMVARGVQQGLGSYDKALPGRVQQINAHPRKR